MWSPRNTFLALPFLFLLIDCFSASAQKEPSVWLFGDHNGIDFRSGTAVAITNPNISYHGPEVRGVATVTDASGDLLFYAENETVYNSAHDTMMNGAGMHSSWGAFQTGLTIRALHDTTLYYLFTVDIHDMQTGPNRMSYSIIDMKEDNGLGAVTTKNHEFLTSTTTQLCAVRHCNERDIWVITHKWESDAYYAYLVSPTGVSATPVISHSGPYYGYQPATWGFGNTWGYMKASPDGKKIAATFMSKGLDLSDFDNATGVVSNTNDLSLLTNFWAVAYGIEFSPNSRLLYATHVLNSGSNSSLYQYNVAAATPAAIRASKTLITSQNFFGYFAAIETGPDGKLYLANYMQPHVSVINQPDVQGAGCNFVWQALALTGRSSHGFPAYMESRYYPEPEFTFSVLCPAEKVSFDYDKPDNIISVKWDFGDPSSGAANNSTGLHPVHDYSAAGWYTVKLIRFMACNSDTLEKQIQVEKLSVSLGNDTAVCTDNGFVLNPSASANVDYLWQDGSSNSSLLANASGEYWLQITDQVTGCSARDTIIVDVKAAPDFTLGPDTVTCKTSLRLDIDVPGATYLWSNGTEEPGLTVAASGLVWLQVNKGDCFYRDTVIVTLSPFTINLGKDTTVCDGAVLLLHADNPALDYTWQDGSKNASFAVKAQGLYFVEATNGVCTAKDSVQVNYKRKPVFSLGADKEICGGSRVILGNQLENMYSYRWEDGSASATRTVTDPGTYKLTGNNECGSFTDEIVVRPGGCVLAVPNAFTPNGDGKNDIFSLSKTNLLPSFSMQIFNRWGQKVFESRDQAQGWNGAFGGKTCEAGNYPYFIQYRKTDGTQATLKGVLLLIR